MTLGERIKQLAREHRYSQSLLGRELGVSQAQVSKWYRNKNEPGNEALARLAELFGVSVDYLLDERLTRFDELPEDERMLVTLYRSLKERHKLDVKGAMNALTDEVSQRARAEVEYAPEVNRPRDQPALPGPKKKGERLG